MVDTIYTLTNSLILYTNKSDAYIEFDLATEVTGQDDREIEALIVNSRTLAVNEINITEPYKILLTMRDITIEEREALAEAYNTQDDSGIITVTQTRKNSDVVRTLTYTNAIPSKNHALNFLLGESIKTASFQVVFQCLKPEIRNG